MRERRSSSSSGANGSSRQRELAYQSHIFSNAYLGSTMLLIFSVLNSICPALHDHFLLTCIFQPCSCSLFLYA